MPDAIEQFGNGSAAFAARRIPGWHALGTVFDRDDMTTEEMLTAAMLANWDVRTEQLTARIYNPKLNEFEFVDVADRFTVLRTHPVNGNPDVLAIVGSKYEPVQNEDVLEFGQAILDNSKGAFWETAGSLYGGRVIFGSIKLPDSILIGGKDAIDQYLLVTSSHDGSMPVTATATPVRVVCANTLNMALKGARNRFTVRHTASVAQKVSDAQKALEITFKLSSVWAELADRLAQVPCDTVKAMRWYEKLDPTPVIEDETKPHATKALTMRNNRADKVMAILTDANPRGDTLGEIRGTAWGALNAFTEAIDWHGREKGMALRAAGFDLPTVAKKEKALDVVIKGAGVKVSDLIAIPA